MPMIKFSVDMLAIKIFLEFLDMSVYPGNSTREGSESLGVTGGE